VKSAFEENTLLNWSPESPICFVHGTADRIVPFKNAQTAYDNLSSQSNAEIRLIPIEEGTHESSGIPAILLMLEYFEEFRESNLLVKLEG
jgi:dipeptidyl aminopeptidase/acylaminoacyl peptidase